MKCALTLALEILKLDAWEPLWIDLIVLRHVRKMKERGEIRFKLHNGHLPKTKSYKSFDNKML